MFPDHFHPPIDPQVSHLQAVHMVLVFMDQTFHVFSSGRVAQLVVQQVSTPEVQGSKPTWG